MYIVNHGVKACSLAGLKQATRRKWCTQLTGSIQKDSVADNPVKKE